MAALLMFAGLEHKNLAFHSSYQTRIMNELWGIVAFGIVTTIYNRIQSRKGILVQNVEFYVQRNLKNL